MAYENINVMKLRNALNNLDSIMVNKRDLSKTEGNLNATNWSENSRVMIKNALVEMEDIYEKIKDYIGNCKMATNYIEEYKKLDNENKQYQKRIERIKDEINSASEDKDTSNLEDKVFNYDNNIAANNLKKKNLKEKINSLIG